MLVKYHILVGVIFCGILFFLFPKINLIGLFLIFLSSIFIDVDHYTYYVYKKKDFSLKRAVNFFYSKMQKFLNLNKELQKNFYGGVFILHSIEFLILIFLLGLFFTNYFYFILLGLTLHLLFDIIFEYSFSGKIYKSSLFYCLSEIKGKELIE